MLKCVLSVASIFVKLILTKKEREIEWWERKVTRRKKESKIFLPSPLASKFRLEQTACHSYLYMYAARLCACKVCFLLHALDTQAHTHTRMHTRAHTIHDHDVLALRLSLSFTRFISNFRTKGKKEKKAIDIVGKHSLNFLLLCVETKRVPARGYDRLSPSDLCQ